VAVTPVLGGFLMLFFVSGDCIWLTVIGTTGSGMRRRL